MANILKLGSGGAKDKCRLLKLGNLVLDGAYYGNGTVSATFNVKNAYNNWDELTLDDFCQPVSYAWASDDGGNGYFQNFVYTYADGIFKVTAKQSTSYNYVRRVTMAVCIIDRFGGGFLKTLSKLLKNFFPIEKGVFING